MTNSYTLRLGNIMQDGVSRSLLKVTLLEAQGFATDVVFPDDMSNLKPGWFVVPVEITDSIIAKIASQSIIKPYTDKPAYVFGEDADRLYWSAGSLFKITPDNGFIRIGPREIKTVDALQNAILFLTGFELNLSPWLKTLK